MSQTLISSVPAVFSALEGLIRKAGEEQSPQIPVFAFELGEYEPAGYVLIHEIEQEPYEWESIGDFAQKESYDICGIVTTFTGDSPFTNPSVVPSTMESVYALLQACVMTPVMSHRDMPILGTTGPTPYLMVPSKSQPRFETASMAGGAAGWCGVIDWSFHFEARLTPG